MIASVRVSVVLSMARIPLAFLGNLLRLETTLAGG
jgi:hypothetical protein